MILISEVLLFTKIKCEARVQITDEILIKSLEVKRLIELALDEDLQYGDATCDSLQFLENKNIALTKFIAKESGIISGLILIPIVIEIAKSKKYIAGNLDLTTFFNDGDFVSKNQIIAELKGELEDILKLERTLLNFLSRMSGVATCTQKMAEILKNSKAKIYDTRKTIPGWRIPDKYSVARGGGRNHRLNLGEHLLIKDNHLEGNKAFVLDYLRKLDRNIGARKLVEVEIDNFAYFSYDEIWNADIIMLDNMNLDELEKSIFLIRDREKANKKIYEIEISGGVSMEDLEKIKNLDVDRISMGRITHSASSFDISLAF